MWMTYFGLFALVLHSVSVVVTLFYIFIINSDCFGILYFIILCYIFVSSVFVVFSTTLNI